MSDMNVGVGQDLGARFAELRRLLVGYLRKLGVREPEDAAQETLLRVVQKQGEGEDILDLRRYAVAIAHHVRQEVLRAPVFVELNCEIQSADTVGDRLEKDDQHLKICLRRLTVEEQKWLEVYFRGRGQERIERRRKLAAKLGITPVALRLRMMRLKEALGECMQELRDMEPGTEPREGHFQHKGH